MAASIALSQQLTAMWLPVAAQSRQPARSARSWNGTPEIFFHKEIDNSRLVRVADAKRNREMAVFSGTLALLFVLVMIYAGQHFSAVEYGYKIEALTAQRDGLTEANRALRLEQASLSDPGRIDALAQRMGLTSPTPGQVVQLDSSTAQEADSPMMARVSDVAVVTAAP
jgi:cell division protein FtsL